MAANDAKDDIISGAFLRAARSWLSFENFFVSFFSEKKLNSDNSYLSEVLSFRILLSFSYMYFYQLTRTNVEYTVIRCNLLDRVNGHHGLFSLLAFFSHAGIPFQNFGLHSV